MPKWVWLILAVIGAYLFLPQLLSAFHKQRA